MDETPFIDEEIWKSLEIIVAQEAHLDSIQPTHREVCAIEATHRLRFNAIAAAYLVQVAYRVPTVHGTKSVHVWAVFWVVDKEWEIEDLEITEMECETDN